jgi:hypothetical protein
MKYFIIANQKIQKKTHETKRWDCFWHLKQSWMKLIHENLWLFTNIKQIKQCDLALKKLHNAIIIIIIIIIINN